MSSQLVTAQSKPVDGPGLPAPWATPGRPLERLTRLAAELLEAPVAMLTLVEAGRQFLVSSWGLDEATRPALEAEFEGTPLEDFARCRRPVVVSGAFQRSIPMACRAARRLGVVSCAGMPLLTPDASLAGSLCVGDFVPRDWTDDQLANLNMLAAVCIEEMREGGFDLRSRSRAK